MRQTIFMFSVLIACIIGALVTLLYIDTNCEKTNEITAVKSVNDSIKITNNK